jgi:protease-4
MSDAELATVDDGRVFTGRQAIGLKLVDQLGGEREAIAWLEQGKKVPHGLPVRDWKPSSGLERWGILSGSARAGDALGLSGLAQVLNRGETFVKAQLLDGLVSIWQVGAAD